MEKIRKILVPLDGSRNSQKALGSAIHLAREHEASLAAIHVIHTFPEMERKRQRSEEDVPPPFIKNAERLAKKAGVPFQSRILTGDPGHAITEYAGTHGIDLIVIGARGMSAFKKIFVGSVSSYVMAKSKTAVMLVK